MHWFFVDFLKSEVAQVVVVLGVVAATGIALGAVRVFNIGLGIAGVLFTGLAAGHLLHHNEIELSDKMLEFTREFGLILFVYTIGVQVGPGFLASLRKEGLPLNIMGAAIVLIGAGITYGIWRYAHVPVPAAVGMFSGASTNTPSLAAAQQALKEVKAAADLQAMPGMGYAVAYPFGVVGIILTMLFVRIGFRIRVADEREAWQEQLEKIRPSLANINIEVKNPSLSGMSVVQIPELANSGVIVSRVLSGGRAQVALRDTRIYTGDVLHAVGPREKLELACEALGTESKVDVRKIEGDVEARRIVVTRRDVLGQTVAELNLGGRMGVMVTRVNRADIELQPRGTRLQFGDSLLCVGDQEALNKAADELGNSAKQLNHPQIIPMFVGIVLGILVGVLPVKFPGLPAPVKLGLAGGPLIVAIILSRIGHIGKLVWYMAPNANFMVRELGIVLFLACVGVISGGRFWDTLVKGDGFKWMALASLITFVPIMLVALVGRSLFKLNYLSLCGLLAGSMTDPPVLAFAGHMTGSEAPHVAYATVYPLAMLLRVLSAQALVLLLF